MIIIVDSNIFISALIKDSFTRKTITQCKELLVMPEFFFHEFREHESEIKSKTKLNITEFNLLVRTLLKYIIIIPEELILPSGMKP